MLGYASPISWKTRRKSPKLLRTLLLSTQVTRLRPSDGAPPRVSAVSKAKRAIRSTPRRVTIRVSVITSSLPTPRPRERYRPSVFSRTIT